MQNLNQLSTLPFDNNILRNALNKDDKSASVYDFSGGYNVIDLLITRGAPARQIYGQDGVFSKPIMGSSTAVAQVAGNNLVGTNLVITFVDPTFNSFREKLVIGDGTAAMALGRVISKAPGTVTIESVSGETLTAAMFAAGTFATEMWIASGNRGSTGVQSIYETPKYVSNQTAITRESLTIFRRDMAETWVQYAGDYWITAQEPLTARRFARGLERKAIWSRFGSTANSSLEGKVSFSKGLKESIMDQERGGVYMGLTGSMTQGQFEGWLAQIADRKNSSKYSITLGCGRGFLRWIQGFNTPMITATGRNNTFGGESVKGLDTYEYSINGIDVKLIMIPFFNDRDVFPGMSAASGTGTFTRMQYTAIVLDVDNYESVDGKMLPAMEKVYFGDEEIIYGYVPGMIGSDLKGSDTLKSGDVKLAVTDKDAVSMELYSDCAYDFMSHRMGWAELVL